MKIELTKTNKYKYCNVFYYFILPYTEKKKAALRILSNIIGESSKKYDAKEKMSNQKDMLYGAAIMCDSNLNCDHLVFNIDYLFLNPKFTKTDSHIYLDFLNEILFNANITKELFEENRRLAIDGIKSALEKPDILAINNVGRIIAEDNPIFHSLDLDIVDEINNLTLEDVVNTYNELINEADVFSCVYGDLDNKTFQEFKNLKLGGNKEYHNKENGIVLNPKKMIIDEKDFSQSILYIVYKTSIDPLSFDIDIQAIGNLMLGGQSTSLLFQEVREKKSLCYDISAFKIQNYRICYIKTNIDAKNADIVIDECNKQIQKLINKDYDHSLLETTKEIFINSIIQIKDSPESLAKRSFELYMNNSYRTIDEKIENIKKITVDDISAYFKGYQQYFIYLLKGIKNE